ncbi:MAG TPA: vitamin B12 dependent-methionine synthase activation domain-containing protein [Candidatus Kapabacteria bacterium]|nr:vitamin B12 dependent-methionine synthase activation domain-containing protein [Candidatus Kapabacteria bacterium]
MEKLKYGDLSIPDKISQKKEPETLAEMIAEIQASRKELLDVITDLAEEDFALPEVFGKWSLRDVLVHFIGWEKITIERANILASGGLPTPIQSEEVNAINDRFVNESTIDSKQQLLVEMTAIFEEMLRALEQISEEAFLRSGEIPPMQKWLPAFTYAHERKHIAKVQSWLQARDGELDNATGEESKMALAKRELPWMGSGQWSVAGGQKRAEQRVARLSDVPTPPFWGVEIREQFILDKVWEYLNEIALFRGQWQLKRGKKSVEEHQKLIEEVARPKLNELKLLCKQQRILQPKAVYGYLPCYSDGDDLIVIKPQKYSTDELQSKWNTNDVSLEDKEWIRFTFPRQPSGKHLCISDFFLTKAEAKKLGRPDVVAMSAVTIGTKASEYTARLFETNQYTDYLYLHGLSVETAEALAEYLHKIIRAELGIEGHDAKDIQRLFSQGYQGSRYSFGYPACPNLEDQTKLFEVLAPERIGISLTEEYHLVPEQSTTAIICHHPEARYFGIK